MQRELQERHVDVGANMQDMQELQQRLVIQNCLQGRWTGLARQLQDLIARPGPWGWVGRARPPSPRLEPREACSLGLT
jgi:hypothetical protein